MTESFLINAAASILGLVTAVWLLSLALRNAGIMDIFWGLGFILVGGVTLVFAGSVGLGTLLLYALVVIWGVRLSLYILLRALGKPEDARYAAWRTQYGKSWWWQSYFRVFLLQGAVMWVVALPIVYGIAHAGDRFPGSWSDVLGGLFFIVGFLFETVADAQLASFKRNPENRGKVLDTGLWAWTRHPNYFGETLLWWGLFLVALPAVPFWTVISPVLMTYMLVRVSGVAMLDRLLAQTKPGYREYMDRTSGFIPWPKRDTR